MNNQDIPAPALAAGAKIIHEMMLGFMKGQIVPGPEQTAAAVIRAANCDG